MPVMATTVQVPSTFALPLKFAAFTSKDKPTLLVMSRRKKQNQGRAVRPAGLRSSDRLETQRERETTYEGLTTNCDCPWTSTR